MKKLAIFVEGQTEQIFIKRLVTEIAGRHRVAIQECRATGGTHSTPRLARLYGSPSGQNTEYFVLIFDCGADIRVKSQILENYDSLVSSGYSAIIGVRDVFPDFTYSQIPELRAGLRYRLKTKPIEVIFALGVMEIETWFIAEHTHFLRLNVQLTTSHINARLGFDPSRQDMQLRPNPAKDLDAIYRLADFTYNKHRSCTQRTVDLLDYAIIYMELIHRLPDLKTLVKSLDAFLSF